MTILTNQESAVVYITFSITHRLYLIYISVYCITSVNLDTVSPIVSKSGDCGAVIFHTRLQSDPEPPWWKFLHHNSPSTAVEWYRLCL